MVVIQQRSSAAELRRKFSSISSQMGSLSADLEILESELDDLVELASSEEPDPTGLLRRCHDFLMGNAPPSETNSCLVSDLDRILNS